MASPRRHAHSHRPTPSVPLPLPTRFGALTSRLPGKNLTPVLYTLINTTPVYLIVSPSHDPHLSLLPLLLSLEPPIAPLQILTACKLRPGDYSIDLNGEAPFVDIWVPFDIARAVCDHLGVSRLFWDVRDPRKGLLGREVARAVSWDESHALGHNWLPSPSSLPPSSYSLTTLLDTPFTSISIIPEDRCITTPIEHGRREQIVTQGLSEDKSTVRPGNWAAAWEALLRWTVQAWEAYLEHPSRPDPATSSIKHMPSHTLLKLVPGLLSPSDPSYTPSLADLQRIISPDALHHTHWQLLMKLLWHLNPFYRSTPPSVQSLELQARVDLGLVESVGLTMVAMWHARTLIQNSHSGDLVPKIVIECSHRDAVDPGRAPPDESSMDDFDELQDRRRSSPPRARRRVRRKSRSSPRVVHHVARVLPRAVEVDEWIDQVIEEAENHVDRTEAPSRSASGLRENGKIQGDATNQEDGLTAVWTEPDGDSVAVFDVEDDESTAHSHANTKPKAEHGVEDAIREEIVKTAKLPWWIMGSAIMIPILAFLLLRYNWKTVVSTWETTRSVYANLLYYVQLVTRYTVTLWTQFQSSVTALWQKREQAKKGIETTWTLARDAWIAMLKIFNQVWLYISAAYAWFTITIELRAA